MSDSHFERLERIVGDYGLLPILEPDFPIGGPQDRKLEMGGLLSFEDDNLSSGDDFPQEPIEGAEF